MWPATPPPPGASVTSRALSLLGAFDQRHRMLSLTELAGARRTAAADGPPAGRRAGRVGRADPLADGRVRHRAAAVGRRAAGAGPDRAAAGGVPVPPRRVCGDARHRAPGGPRRHQVLYVERLPGRPRCRSSARSAPGFRCTAPESARCCSRSRPRRCSARCWPRLPRVTPHTVTPPGCSPPAAPGTGRRVCDDGRGDEPRRLLGGRPDPAGHRRRRLGRHRRPQPATRPPPARLGAAGRRQRHRAERPGPPLTADPSRLHAVRRRPGRERSRPYDADPSVDGDGRPGRDVNTRRVGHLPGGPRGGRRRRRWGTARCPAARSATGFP